MAEFMMSSRALGLALDGRAGVNPKVDGEKSGLPSECEKGVNFSGVEAISYREREGKNVL